MPTLLFSTAGHLSLFGQTVTPGRLQLPGAFKLVAYFLRPEALTALSGIPAFELTDRPLVLPATLQERLLNAFSTDQLLELIDDYLYAKICTARPADPRMVFAAARLSGSADVGILRTLQQELCLTELTFQRLFEQQIGVSPNQFRRISQFNRAFRQINAGSPVSLATVAYQQGYADQSHLIRAFKEFTDLTPTAYLRARP